MKPGCSPTLLARVAISSQAHELSVIQVSPAGIRPLSFNFNDGSNSSEKDVRLDFDWNALTVTGTFEGRPVVVIATHAGNSRHVVRAGRNDSRAAGWPEAAGLQDHHRGQVARIPLLARGHAAGHDALRQVEAEVWASQRTGSNRVTKTWHAASLGYVPVQAIQYRKGNPEVQIRLVPPAAAGEPGVRGWGLGVSRIAQLRV